MKVVYGEKQIADPGLQTEHEVPSPSAKKPKEVAEALRNEPDVEFILPEPVTIEDLKRCHDPEYVDGVMSLKVKNGFGTISQSVVDSLPYTNGAQYLAAKLAKPDSPTCALVSGFHHAGYHGWENLGWFCTFNGLMVAAAKLIEEDHKSKILILDCDQHWGNGTDDILKEVPELAEKVTNISFGHYFWSPHYARFYLEWLEPDGRISSIVKQIRPDVIIYQAGADVHINDPYGGVLTTEEMYERDVRVFSLAKELGVPITWNLAGGYQISEDGKIDKVIELHLNTFKACRKVYGNG